MAQASSGRRRRYRAGVVALSTVALAASMTVTAVESSAAPAAPAAPAGPKVGTSQKSDVRELAPKTRYSTSKLSPARSNRIRAHAQAAGVTPPVGTTRTLIALDDYNGILYRKSYTLQAVGDKIEVWVADDTSFPAGDCRLQVPNTTTVTQAQAQELADQFDENMFPKESAAFSVAPDRDGSGNVVSGVDASGDGDKIMTLVDNVRDDNYYEGVNVAPTYIAGFFSSQFNELLDRNIMTIDAYDWAHRTTRNPPDGTTSDPCTSRPPKPFLYEGTFAHEYQHLLEYYQDPSEVSWVNEGLSDFAQTLVGYVNARLTVNQKGADSHIFCYQGFGLTQTPSNPNVRDCGGPENSLTLWGDQAGQSAILADYGEAYSFMLFLYDRYGLDFMSRLHRDGAAQGLEGLQDALDDFAPGTDRFDVLHDFQTMTLIDREVGVAGGQVTGIDKARVTSASLKSGVQLNNPRSYAQPGAPANGADYVLLRNAKGRALQGANLSSLSFEGASSLVPEALKWSVVASPPLHEGNPALWSGNESNLDASAVTQYTVPEADPTLTFSEYHLAEATYDYAYTVISTDGGKTYTALANANTVAGPYGPALNGDAADWTTQTFDLSDYAGEQVIIGFRYVSDGGVNDGGWYVDDVRVGANAVNDGTTTEPFRSTTQIRPVDVANWNVRLVGIDPYAHRATVVDVPQRSFTLDDAQLAQLTAYRRIVALVAYDEPTEQYQPQALYTLTVNGVVQPGGGQESGPAA